ncbi:hypothetical protein PR202_gb01115 [Eleusine coracana subsp. coracana]|uniref:Uncharacterized protein n=1 Tax=Eleusine coracana subsp. coracana TaxID=191504 RepID=A0AAV5DTC1_ELECO|nr:hypothetical protein PR202_gb01115 [Eleusine coracana subsp. coracana]
MDRSARRTRARARGGEAVAAPEQPASSSSRSRRSSRGKEPAVVIDLDGEDDCGGEAADGAASGSGGSAAAASSPPPPMVVPAGAVAMRTRSRRRVMQAAAAAEDATPRSKRRRKGATADAVAAPVSGRSKAAAASRSAPRETRSVRSRRKSEPASRGRTRKQADNDSPAPAKKERPVRGKKAKVSRANESDDNSGRGDDASDQEMEEPRSVSNGINRGGRIRRGVSSGDQIEIEKHGGTQEVTAANLHQGSNEVISSDAEGAEGIGGAGRAQQVVGFNVREDRGECGNRELLPIRDIEPEETVTFEEDYNDDEMLEEQLVGEVIRAYSNGGDFNPDGEDWEAEDEMGFTDDGGDGDSMDHADGDGDSKDDANCDGDSKDDADGTDMAEPMHNHSKMEMQNVVNHKIALEIKDQIEPKKVGAPGRSRVEVLDSDEEVMVLNNVSSAPTRKASVQAKLPVISSCVAWRTRSSWGINQDRLSYNTYFEALSDEPKEDDDDDTEVELDEEDEDNDDSTDSYTNDEEEKEEAEEEEEAKRRKLKNPIDACEEEEDAETRKLKNPTDAYKEEEEAERRKLKNPIDASNDELIGSTVPISKYDFAWEEYEGPEADIYRPMTYKKGGRGYPVCIDTLTEEQKRSRFTWELERRKKLKLGMTSPRLYERNLDSDSDSSGSGQIKRYGFQKVDNHKVGSKKKHTSSNSGKNSSQATALKRQSLMKLLIDKMSDGKTGGSLTFDQNPQLKFTIKEMHPLVFSFGDEDPIPAEKSKQDVALDMLWADLDFALESENIGTYYDDEVSVFSEKPTWTNGSGVKNALMFHELYEQAGCGSEQYKDYHLYGTVWDLIPGVITTMYEHQCEAFEFMWTNLVGDIKLDELKHGAKPDVVGGCVVCHAPGTGKTRLAIVFIQTYMKVFPDCRPVIIAPRGMLFAWDEEFKKWNVDVPFHIMNTTDYTGKEDRDICSLIKKEHRTEKLTRLVKLLSWNKGHGILGISYGLYSKLTSEKPGCTEENKVRSILLDNPGLLVLDEGHTPRNDRSVMWKTLGKVKTEKRIILSGTPFQNNFLELYNILCLVRPRFGEMFLTKGKVGRRHYISKKQRDKFSDKYEKGVWASLTSNVTDDNAEKVRSILKPFVHIHNGNILRTLPGLRESVIILKPAPLQKSIIRKVENIGSGNNFEHEYVISLASTHPSLVTAINMSDEEASLIDKTMLAKLRSNPYEGVKTRFVIEVVRLCEALREKVLIFSQFIQPLELIKEHLRKFFKWREGKEILQMDGKILPRYRQASIEAFNNPNDESKVLLASTRACCEGISLTGASRVVLLDVVWNPAVGRQAISRAFRIGQKKFVYTYNLITYGTGEGDKYDRQAEKDHLSKLVFSTEDEFNNVRNMLSKAEMEHCSKLISEDRVLEEMTSHDQLKGMFLKIHYPPTESNIVYTYNQIAP